MLDGDPRDIADLSAPDSTQRPASRFSRRTTSKTFMRRSPRGRPSRHPARRANVQPASRVAPGSAVPRRAHPVGIGNRGTGIPGAALRRSQRVVVADRAFDVRASPRMTTWRAPCRSLRSTRAPAPRRCSRRRLRGARAVPATRAMTMTMRVESGRAVGELRQAASLVASLLTRAAALVRLFDRRLVALLAVVAFVVLASALVIWSASTHYDLLDSAYFTSRPCRRRATATSRR